MRQIRLAIDVMGGDHGLPPILHGVLKARDQEKPKFLPVLCGDRRGIVAGLLKAGVSPRELDADFVIEHCAETITRRDAPSRAWKNKADSSIVRCIALQRERRVDASVSAGNTGILLAASIFILGRLPKVQRPALAAFLPTARERPALLLDVGANLGCRAEHLVAFAFMGRSYYRRCFGIVSPAVRLLNIGKEQRKGTEAITAAGRELGRVCPGYAGFAEGSDVLTGVADVIVCDGFAGNVLLKACESFHTLVESVLGHDRRVLDAIKTNMSILNAENYGAVPLLGINGIVLKAHGSSSAVAIAHALKTTIHLARNRASLLRDGTA
jgi:glycerol-3-phosphate acyltransferase PlsX